MRLEFTVAAHAVLLSNFNAWHFVLNGWYLPRNLADGERFDKWRHRRRIDVNHLTSRHGVERAVERSRDRIFTVSSRPGSVQACIRSNDRLKARYASSELRPHGRRDASPPSAMRHAASRCVGAGFCARHGSGLHARR